MTPEELDIELLRAARTCAALSKEKHSYLPKTVDAHHEFVPHDWVMAALRRAYRTGQRNAYQDTANICRLTAENLHRELMMSRES